MRSFIPLIWMAFVAIGMGQASAANTNDHANVLTLEHNMKRGDTLRAEDLGWLKIKSTQIRAPGLYATDRQALVGMELKRSLRAGQPLRHSDVKRPATVRKGDPVTLVYSSPGLRLSVEGRALADAATGHAVRVMNLYSRRAIDAVVISAGLAEVPTR